MTSEVGTDLRAVRPLVALASWRWPRGAGLVELAAWYLAPWNRLRGTGSVELASW